MLVNLFVHMYLLLKKKMMVLPVSAVGSDHGTTLQQQGNCQVAANVIRVPWHHLTAGV